MEHGGKERRILDDEVSVVHERRWGSGFESTPTHAIVSAVADHEGCDPVELPPLFESIDTEALDRLFGRPGSAPERVAFRYRDLRVVVTGTTVRLQALDTDG